MRVRSAGGATGLRPDGAQPVAVRPDAQTLATPMGGRGGRRPSVAMAVGRFMAASLIVMLLLTAAGLVVQHRFATEEALHDAKEITELSGRGIVAPLLTDAALAGDPRALARLDSVVRERVIGDRVVRVKVWSEEGRILYSDEPRLIGDVYPLDDEDLAAFDTRETEAELSHLAGPENRFERRWGELLEVYLPVATAGGPTVLYESYQPSGVVFDDEQRLWRAFAPPLLGAVLLLWIVQAPLAWSMARRLRAGQSERERLLRGTVQAAERERRTIASDLHDGVVQDLAGAAMSLAAVRSGVRASAPERTERLIDEGVATIRGAMRDLRDLIIAIGPATPDADGLARALEDLVAPLEADGIRTAVDVPGGLDVGPEVARLVHRVAQEAIRNAHRHADARQVTVTVAGVGDRLRLVVEDDGTGFSGRDRARARRDGHVGLDLLAALADDAGAALEIRSAPGSGTRVVMEVAVR